MSLNANQALAIGALYDSFQEFDDALKLYCSSTFQNFTKRSSHNLKTSDLHKETEEKKKELIERFKFKDANFECIHSGCVKKNLNKTCPKRNTHSLKIGCEANFRVNFDLKIHKLRISQFQPVHTQHETNKNLYDHYSNTRKPASKDLDEMVHNIQKNGAKLNMVVTNYNKQHGTALTNKDIQNHKQKLNQVLDLQEDVELEKYLDELSKVNGNTIITKKSEKDILESVFIMTNEQKEWVKKYPEVLHLDGTHKTNKSKYVLYTFLVQVVVL
jgi:hypothetical protein